MHILLSNDDGIDAKGIQALETVAHRMDPTATVSVVAPAQNVSSASSAITLRRGIKVERVAERRYAVHAMPADCVHLAMTGLIEKPDLVLCGINSFANLGEDTIYSGTVATALQGYLFGVDAVCVSQIDYGWHHLETAAAMTGQVLRRFLALEHETPMLLNVNVPMVPLEQIRGIRVTRLGRREYPGRCFEKDGLVWLGPLSGPKDAAPGTDFDAVANNYVSVTPLQSDLTNAKALACVKEWFKDES